MGRDVIFLLEANSSIYPFLPSSWTLPYPWLLHCFVSLFFSFSLFSVNIFKLPPMIYIQSNHEIVQPWYTSKFSPYPSFSEPDSLPSLHFFFLSYLFFSFWLMYLRYRVQMGGGHIILLCLDYYVSKHTWPWNSLQSLPLQGLCSTEPTLESIGQSVTFQNCFCNLLPSAPGVPRQPAPAHTPGTRGFWFLFSVSIIMNQTKWHFWNFNFIFKLNLINLFLERSSMSAHEKGAGRGS